jgi:hypothetical protein
MEQINLIHQLLWGFSRLDGASTPYLSIVPVCTYWLLYRYHIADRVPSLDALLDLLLIATMIGLAYLA